jgi:hypothetical protein
MKSGYAGFNVARSLKEFIAAARESDKEFSILPLSKEGNNICRAAYVPNTKDGIGNYYRHVIKFNNINGSMRIRISMDIGKLKQAGSAFRMYLQSKRVYINKAQLGIEEGVTLGWLHQAHPAFCYREDIKERLRELMGEEHKEVQYALFPKSINYERVSDGVRLTTTGVTMQIAKSPNVTAADFRASMAEKWQRINVKNGGNLYRKTFIPFGKEGDMGDAILTNVIQQQNKFLAETKQRIVHNLNDVDEIIEIALGEDVDMDPTGITLRDIFFNYQDKIGNRLVDEIEKKSTGGTYRFIFQQSKTEEVDKMLEHIDNTLTSIGDWDECHMHFRYLPSMPISVVGRIPRTTNPSLWANNLSQFSTAIPSEISTEFLQQPKANYAAWTKVSYSDAAKGVQCQDTTATSVSTAQHSVTATHLSPTIIPIPAHPNPATSTSTSSQRAQSRDSPSSKENLRRSIKSANYIKLSKRKWKTKSAQ